MDELIKRQEAIDAIIYFQDKVDNEDAHPKLAFLELAMAIGLLPEAPFREEAEIRFVFRDNGRLHRMFCECGRQLKLSLKNKYCPHCGRKLDTFQIEEAMTRYKNDA